MSTNERASRAIIYNESFQPMKMDPKHPVREGLTMYGFISYCKANDLKPSDGKVLTDYVRA